MRKGVREHPLSFFINSLTAGAQPISRSVVRVYGTEKDLLSVFPVHDPKVYGLFVVMMPAAHH